MNREPEPAESLPDAQLGEQLGTVRPVPSARFRGRLRQHLAARDPGYGPRPQRLRLMVFAYLVLGLLLMGLAALLAL